MHYASNGVHRVAQRFPRFLQGVAGFWGFGVVGFDLCSSAQLLNFSGLGGRFGFACVVVPVNAVPAWLL